MSRLPGGIWRSPAFRYLWAAQTVSVFGSQISTLALPLTAILILKATPMQMGLLQATQSAPALLFGLAAGAWVDRLPRRPIMVIADLSRAALLGAVPIAAWLGMLRIEALYAIGLLTGILNILFTSAQQSLVPSLVAPARLVEANSALEASRSVAQVAGPGLAGALVGLLTAPIAVLADALSFVVSACCLAAARSAETAPETPTGRTSIWREAGEGVRAVLNNPILRVLTFTSAIFNLFDGVLFAVYLLYMTRVLHIGPTLVGVAFAIGGIGGLLGALLAGPLAHELGLGRALVGGVALAGLGEVCIGIARGAPLAALLMIAAAETAVEFGGTVYGVNGLSIRQSVTPDRLQGRVNATVQSLGVGLWPLGALAGGALGQLYGLRATALIAGLGTLSAFVLLLASPARTIKRGT